jgi:hypothetical protein
MYQLYHYTIFQKPKSEIIKLLLDIYMAQEKWDEAQSLLLEKITAGSRDKSGNNGAVLMGMLTLVDVLIHKASYTEALLYRRRALKSYRKMGSDGSEGVESSLESLVRVCHLNGNYDEEDAYAAILADFLHLNAPKQNSSDATQSNAQHMEPLLAASQSPVAPQETSFYPGKQQSSLLDAGQQFGTMKRGELAEDQTSNIPGNVTQFTKDDRVQQSPAVVLDLLPKLFSIQSISIEDETPEIFSQAVFEEPVLERMSLSNVDIKPVG